MEPVNAPYLRVSLPLLSPPSSPSPALASASSLGLGGYRPLKQVDHGGQHDGEVEGGEALLDDPGCGQIEHLSMTASA